MKCDNRARVIDFVWGLVFEALAGAVVEDRREAIALRLGDSFILQRALAFFLGGFFGEEPGGGGGLTGALLGSPLLFGGLTDGIPFRVDAGGSRVGNQALGILRGAFPGLGPFISLLGDAHFGEFTRLEFFIGLLLSELLRPSLFGCLPGGFFLDESFGFGFGGGLLGSEVGLDPGLEFGADCVAESEQLKAHLGGALEERPGLVVQDASLNLECLEFLRGVGEEVEELWVWFDGHGKSVRAFPEAEKMANNGWTQNRACK